MAIVGNERGAALITALMLTVLALVISMTLLYSVIIGTKISASQRRYRTALAAAHGGVELLTQEIIPKLFQGTTSEASLAADFGPIHLSAAGFDCLRRKLDHASADWSGACTAQQASADPSQAPDVSFLLAPTGSSAPGYQISGKIVDTIPGNSDKSGLDFLDAGTAVSGREEVVHPQHVPAIYSLAVQGVREGGGNRERARLSVLYAY